MSHYFIAIIIFILPVIRLVIFLIWTPGSPKTWRRKDQIGVESKCLDISVQLICLRSAEASWEVWDGQDGAGEPREHVLYEQHHPDPLYGHRVSCSHRHACTVYEQIVSSCVNIKGERLSQFQEAGFITIPKRIQHTNEKAPAALCLPRPHSGKCLLCCVMDIGLCCYWITTIDAKEALCVCDIRACLSYRGQRMLPKISWKHLGLPGSIWALSRTVQSTLDFFWTGTVVLQPHRVHESIVVGRCEVTLLVYLKGVFWYWWNENNGVHLLWVTKC